MPAVDVTERPVYTRSQVAFIIAGAELEKGDIAKQRDEALERAKLGAGYADRLQLELAAERARGAWLPWVVGLGAAALAAAIAGVSVHFADLARPAAAGAPPAP